MTSHHDFVSVSGAGAGADGASSSFRRRSWALGGLRPSLLNAVRGTIREAAAGAGAGDSFVSSNGRGGGGTAADAGAGGEGVARAGGEAGVGVGVAVGVAVAVGVGVTDGGLVGRRGEGLRMAKLDSSAATGGDQWVTQTAAT